MGSEGDYDFALRRWPAEAGHIIGAGIDGDDVAFTRDGIAESDWWIFTGGKALEIDTAHLEVSGYAALSAKVGDEAEAVMRIALAAGHVHVSAHFGGADGLKQAPYYLYVRKVG